LLEHLKAMMKIYYFISHSKSLDLLYRPAGRSDALFMKKAHRYNTSCRLEFHFEPGSYGRALCKLIVQPAGRVLGFSSLHGKQQYLASSLSVLWRLNV